MTLLVLSDTHYNSKNIEFAVRQTNPDAVLHLGDNISDAFELKHKMPELTIHMVPGNSDPPPRDEGDKLLHIENVNIYLTHGHTHDVKTELTLLTNRAKKQGADLILFGHTHNAAVVYEQDIVLLNPGQMEFHNKNKRASYGIVNIEDGKFDCKTVYLPDTMFNIFEI